MHFILKAHYKKTSICMYEKNCLTNAIKTELSASPFTLVVQMNPLASNENTTFLETLHSIDSSIQIKQIPAHRIQTNQTEWINPLLSTITGTCRIVCIHNLNTFKKVLKKFQRMSKHHELPCSIIAGSYGKTLLNLFNINTLTNKDIKIEDILVLQQVPLDMLFTVNNSITQLLSLTSLKANNGN